MFSNAGSWLIVFCIVSFNCCITLFALPSVCWQVIVGVVVAVDAVGARALSRMVSGSSELDSMGFEWRCLCMGFV